MSNNKKHKKKNCKPAHDTLALVKSGFVGLYVFFMLVIFVLYAPEKYIYIGNHKISFFEKVTFVFLACTLILFIVSLIKKLLSKEKISVKFSLPEISLLLYGGWNLISFALSEYKNGSLWGYDGWHTGLLFQLSVIAVFFAVKRWKLKYDSLIIAAVVTLMAEGIMVISQRFGNDPFGFYANMGYMDWNRRNLLGTIGNTNWLMGYEIIIIPILIWLYIESKKIPARILWGIGNIIMIGAIFLQDSSSGIVAFAVILLFLIWVYVKDPAKLARVLEIVCMIFLFWSLLSIYNVKLLEPEEKDTTRYYTLLWLIPLLLFGIMVAGLYYYIKKKGQGMPKAFILLVRVGMIAGATLLAGGLIAVQFSDTLWRILGSKESLRISDASGSFRILLWKQCIKHYLFETDIKHFVFGFGPDCFGYWYATKNIVIPVAGGPFMDAVFTNAHNDYLTAVINLGIPGLISYLFVFLSMAVNAVNSLLKKKETKRAMLLLLILIGYAVNNAFSFQTVCATPIFFIIIGLVMAGPGDESVKSQNQSSF